MLLVHTSFIRQKLTEQIKEHRLLFECFFVAISLHIALIPIIWIMSWALPWPKSPVFTVTIEYELDKLTHSFKPKELSEYRDPKLNP
jgi:hypothetical protein